MLSVEFFYLSQQYYSYGLLYGLMLFKPDKKELPFTKKLSFLQKIKVQVPFPAPAQPELAGWIVVVVALRLYPYTCSAAGKGTVHCWEEAGYLYLVKVL